MITPHELPKQQELEGSTETEHTLYSHANIITPETNSFQNLEYIYQHFQDNEKIHESDPSSEIVNTLYPYPFILIRISSMVYSKMSLTVII